MNCLKNNEIIYEFDTYAQAQAVSAILDKYMFHCNVCGKVHCHDKNKENYSDTDFCCKEFVKNRGVKNKHDRMWLPYIEILLALKKNSPDYKKIKMRKMKFEEARKKFKNFSTALINGPMWVPIIKDDKK